MTGHRGCIGKHTVDALVVQASLRRLDQGRFFDVSWMWRGRPLGGWVEPTRASTAAVARLHHAFRANWRRTGVSWGRCRDQQVGGSLHEPSIV